MGEREREMVREAERKRGGGRGGEGVRWGRGRGGSYISADCWRGVRWTVSDREQLGCQKRHIRPFEIWQNGTDDEHLNIERKYSSHQIHRNGIELCIHRGRFSPFLFCSSTCLMQHWRFSATISGCLWTAVITSRHLWRPSNAAGDRRQWETLGKPAHIYTWHGYLDCTIFRLATVTHTMFFCDFALAVNT